MSNKTDAALQPTGQSLPTNHGRYAKGYAWMVWALAAISFGYA